MEEEIVVYETIEEIFPNQTMEEEITVKIWIMVTHKTTHKTEILILTLTIILILKDKVIQTKEVSLIIWTLTMEEVLQTREDQIQETYLGMIHWKVNLAKILFLIQIHKINHRVVDVGRLKNMILFEFYVFEFKIIK